MSALLFACAFWILDTGSELWRSDAGLFAAIVPQGDQFLMRLLYASIFAVAGSIAGAAVQRGRDLEEFAIEKLRDSERKYHALLASSFDSVLILGSDARIVEVSDSAAALFGCSARAMTGTAIDNFVEIEAGMNPQLGDRFSDHLRDVERPGHEVIAVRAHGVHGRRFPAEIRVTPMPPGGQSLYTLAIRETTSTVVAQKALRHSERRYQALFENIPDGVYRSLPNGRLLAGNPALQRMLGYDSMAALLASANTRDFFCDQLQREALMTKLEESGEARNFELSLKRRDGSKLLALANISVVNNDDNEGVVYEGTLTDISELQEARSAMRESEEHFRALCEHALDVINVINTDGEITYSNPSSTCLSHRSPAEQIGLKLFRSVHPEDLPEVSRLIAEGFARPGTPKRFTCRVVREDGALRFIEAVGVAFQTHKGELRAVIHSRDLTEHVEATGKLGIPRGAKPVGATAA